MSLHRHIKAYNAVLKAIKKGVLNTWKRSRSPSAAKREKAVMRGMRTLAHTLPRAARYYFEGADYDGDFDSLKKSLGEGFDIFKLPNKAVVYISEDKNTSAHREGVSIVGPSEVTIIAEQIGTGRISVVIFLSGLDADGEDACNLAAPKAILTRNEDPRRIDVALESGYKLSRDMENYVLTWFSYMQYLLHKDRAIEEIERFYDLDYQGQEADGVTNIFRTVRIHADKPRVRYTGESQATGRKNRYHGVRGHYVHYDHEIKSGPNQGKTKVFRAAHNRGDPSKGRVYKDYEVVGQ
jgi:hypothetical protein